ncbi:hypothetical protein [Saccharopolyspora tripterygii]
MDSDFVPIPVGFAGRVRNVTRAMGIVSVVISGVVMIGIAVSGFMLLAQFPAAAIFAVILGWLAGAFALSSALALATSAACVNTGSFNKRYARRSRRTLAILVFGAAMPTVIAVVALAASASSASEFPVAAGVCLSLLWIPFALSVINMVVGLSVLDPGKAIRVAYGSA